MPEFLSRLFHAPRQLVEIYQAFHYATRSGQTDVQGHPICRICARQFSDGDLCSDCEMNNNSW